jgi:glutamate dehydrogenase/leucine dehydrogenase
MVKTFWEVYKSSVKNSRDMRTEAMTIAVKRVAEAVKVLGIWP